MDKRQRCSPVVVDIARALNLADGKDVRVHGVSRESPIPNGLTAVAVRNSRR